MADEELLMETSEVQEIRVTVKELEEKVALADLLEQLHNNKAFKKVILEGYFTDRAVELAKATSQVALNEQSKTIHYNALVSISGLQAYFSSIYRDGECAKQSIDEHNELLSMEATNG